MKTVLAGLGEIARVSARSMVRQNHHLLPVVVRRLPAAHLDSATDDYLTHSKTARSVVARVLKAALGKGQ